VHQGALADCFLVGSVGALIAHHPERMKSMIKEQSDGSYIVRFPGRPEPIKVWLTDAQIALGSSAGKQGLWLNVMEEAIAIERRGKGDSSVVTDLICNGGSGGRTIALLTGREVKEVNFAGAARDQTAVEEETMKILLAVHEDKIVATTGFRDKVAKPQGLISSHTYAIIDYDPDKELVTLWNPYGNHIQPKGPAGLTNGYPTQDGMFTMPLSDYFRVFRGFRAETPAPHRLRMTRPRKSTVAGGTS
jgi:hypothetical protein